MNASSDFKNARHNERVDKVMSNIIREACRNEEERHNLESTLSTVQESFVNIVSNPEMMNEFIESVGMEKLIDENITHHQYSQKKD